MADERWQKEKLDFLSSNFDPLKALYTPELQPPVPNIQIFNNLAAYARAIRDGQAKIKASSKEPTAEVTKILPSRTRNLKPDEKKKAEARINAVQEKLKFMADKGLIRADTELSGVRRSRKLEELKKKAADLIREDEGKRAKNKKVNVLDKMEGTYAVFYSHLCLTYPPPPPPLTCYTPSCSHCGTKGPISSVNVIETSKKRSNSVNISICKLNYSPKTNQNQSEQGSIKSQNLSLPFGQPTPVLLVWSYFELAWSSVHGKKSHGNFHPCTLEPSFPPFGHSANSSQLSPSCFTIVRWLCGHSQTNEWFSCELAWVGSTVWPPAVASFDFVTWLELGVPFGQGLTDMVFVEPCRVEKI